MKILLLVISFLTIQGAAAHGIHDSGEAKAQRGGILKSLETIHVELVQIGTEVRVYTFNKDKKPKLIKTGKYPVAAKIILPREKGSEKIKLIDKKDYWSVTYKKKGIHRYTFELSIEQGGHKDKLSFTIEPSKK